MYVCVCAIVLIVVWNNDTGSDPSGRLYFPAIHFRPQNFNFNEAIKVTRVHDMKAYRGKIGVAPLVLRGR